MTVHDKTRLAPPCVDVSSGVEARENGKQLKGMKDAIRIREFVAAVQAADAGRHLKNN